MLEERGYRIVASAGSSMGALVAGMHAAGKLTAYRDWAVSLQRGNLLRLLDFAFGHPGLIRGDRLMGVLKSLIGEHQIEELPVRFTAVATDLGAQREVWLNRGPLFDAIRASIAIPMLFTPHHLDGRELVDGGLLAPVPMAAARQSAADLVVAVDVNSRSARPLTAPEASEIRDEANPPEAIARASNLRARLSALVESFADKPATSRSAALARGSMLDLVSRSLDTMQGQLSRLQLALDPPDLLIRVPRDSAMFHEYWRAKELIQIGRDAAERALAASH